MAKNFHSPGRNLTLPAPAATESGDLVAVGSIVGVALTAAAANADLTVATTGVYRLPKVAADALTVGARVYRVAAAGDDRGKATVTAAGNLLAGVAVAAAAANSTSALIRLNGSF